MFKQSKSFFSTPVGNGSWHSSSLVGLEAPDPRKDQDLTNAIGWYINTDPPFEDEGVFPYDWSQGANCGLMSLLPDCVSPRSRLCSLAEQ